MGLLWFGLSGPIKPVNGDIIVINWKEVDIFIQITVF